MVLMFVAFGSTASAVSGFAENIMLEETDSSTGLMRNNQLKQDMFCTSYFLQIHSFVLIFLRPVEN